jgi:bacteriorhodopsin
MADATDRVLWIWTVAELAGLAALLVLLVASVTGETAFLSSVSREIRVAAAAFVAVELLIPLLVYLDVRRQPDGPRTIWLHAVATPVVNVLGLVAYLAVRTRRSEQ